MISVAQALEERLTVVAGRHPELVPIPRWLQEHRTSNISLKGFVYDTDNIRPDLTGKLRSIPFFGDESGRLRLLNFSASAASTSDFFRKPHRLALAKQKAALFKQPLRTEN